MFNIIIIKIIKKILSKKNRNKNFFEETSGSNFAKYPPIPPFINN